ncbi:hypothetical protein HZS_6328 [Henneguya salminicola]|nr:hypothetical protein HZS_6328 [Henneguya salminicola]
MVRVFQDKKLKVLLMGCIYRWKMIVIVRDDVNILVGYLYSRIIKGWIIYACNIEEIIRRKIRSNLIIAVINSQKQRTFFYFIDIDRNRIGPYYTRVLLNHTLTYSEVKNDNFRVTGFTIRNMDSLYLSERKYVLSDDSVIFMIPRSTTNIPCRAVGGVRI